MKPRLVVIAGPNGSGKTSITEQLRDLRHKWMCGCIYVNPDDIALEKFGDWNNPSSVLEAANYATNLREQLLRERKDFAFETVLSTREKVNFIKKAKDAGYFIRVFFVGTDHPKINAARILSRLEDGGHGVPIEKILSRYTKSMANSVSVAQLADRMYFYDNSEEIESGENKEWLPIFRTESGKIVEKYTHPQNHPWAADIFDALKSLSAKE
ncbi:MAG: zeta toxin family protein [Opitutales bacterium]|nr:zeta toxin family protein [Opitutales bacterium]